MTPKTSKAKTSKANPPPSSMRGAKAPNPAPAKRQKTVPITFEQAADLQRRAAQYGVSVSELLRQVVVSWLALQARNDAAREPKQMKLPVSPEIRRLLRNVNHALTELIDAKKRRNASPAKHRTPKGMM